MRCGWMRHGDGGLGDDRTDGRPACDGRGCRGHDWSLGARLRQTMRRGGATGAAAAGVGAAATGAAGAAGAAGLAAAAVTGGATTAAGRGGGAALAAASACLRSRMALRASPGLETLERSNFGLVSAAGLDAVLLLPPFEVLADLLCLVGLDGAGVGLSGYADCFERIQNRPALDFQFPRQIVDSNFAHPSLFVFLCP